MTHFVQPEKIEIDANERAVNEKSPYCFFVCTTFDSFLNDLMSLLYHNDTIIKKEKELLRALLIQFCKLEFLDAYNMRKKLNFILNIVLSFTAIL